MFKPSTLIVAFGLAQLQEEEVTRKQYPYQNTQTQNNPYSPSLKPTPLRLLGQNSIPRLPAPNPILRLPTFQNPRLNPPFQERNHYPIKRVSPNQMQERRDKELCYFCDEKYHWGHKCSKPKLYLLERMEFEGGKRREFKEEETLNQLNTVALPTTQQAELLGISLHAIARAPSPKTLRLVGKIGTCLVIVLIDIGSTHSFIDVNVVRRAKLPVGEGHLAVQVSDGDTLLCLVCCKVVFLKMQSCNILANLFLLTLGGCDVVLGVDWLRSLGTIKWNFADLSMSFFVEMENLFLQGLRLPKKAIKEEHSLSKAALIEGRGIWLQFMEISDKPGEAPIELALQAVLSDFKQCLRNLVNSHPPGVMIIRSNSKKQLN
ncbi:hypothetical protein I3760_07G031900 [Carya illinoinensis]|nr:hypothetical protein I3760_07G031900 [Carya illinoinensis]